MFKTLRFGVIATIFSLLISAPASATDTGVASMLHTLRSEKAQVCLVGHFHYGKSPRAFPSRDKAYKTAVNHWVTFTVAEYGTDWGHYNRASHRSANCEKASRTSWTCKVQARPCRKGLSVARR
ncbi:MAG: hypothetical protein GY927_22750 [bacterium]|nr:hypothetical protein [bacterium]